MLGGLQEGTTECALRQWSGVQGLEEPEQNEVTALQHRQHGVRGGHENVQEALPGFWTLFQGWGFKY